VSALHRDALRVLGSWRVDDAEPDAAEQERLRASYVAHLQDHPDGLSRSCLPAHLTASALVLDATATQVLLTLHRKGGFWGQFGGHCEPEDLTLAEAALREAREESGIAEVQLVGSEPVDLDRHALSAAFGGCREHLDVRYAAVVPAGARPVASAESHDVAWWPVDALPAGCVDIAGLVRRARAAVTAGRG
jgi:8-oxo-dGTP pyrophosphatase MutT (NUDIX family)